MTSRQVSAPASKLDNPLDVKITSGGAGYVGFDLPGVAEAVPAARSLLRRSLGAHATDDLVLCASELVTNAIRHTRSGLLKGRFLLTVQVEGGGLVLVSVLDEGARTPQDHPALGELPGEHGRGLAIVRALAIESGSTRIFNGRLSWFRISVTRDAPRDAPRDATLDADRDGRRDATLDADGDTHHDTPVILTGSAA